MAENIKRHITHIKSKIVENGSPKLPTSSQIQEGEIAVNYAKGYETLSVKNESGDVVTFSSDNYYSEKKLGSGFTGSNSAKTVTEVIEENEETFAFAIDDIESRKADKDALASLSNTVNDLVSESGSYLPLSGGTMTGDITFSSGGLYINGANNRTFGILKSSNDRNIDIGWDYINTDGAFAYFRNSDYTNEQGDFGFFARNTSGQTLLLGKADGRLTWGGHGIIHDGNSAHTHNDLYYDKNYIDTKVGSGFSVSSITDVIIENERIVATSYNDLNDNKLSISGGTMTGNLLFEGANNRTFGIKKTNGNRNIDIGWDWVNGDGSGAFFRSADESDNPGGFGFFARSGFTVTELVGVPGGSLTWGNNVILHAGNSAHTHDDRYYTKGEMDTTLGTGFSESSVTEVIQSISGGGSVDIASNQVTAMTDYTIAASGTAIESGDTLNQAIGKLEKMHNEITDYFEDKELATAAALTDLNDRKADVSSAVTSTTDNDYVKMTTVGGDEVKITKDSFVQAMASILNTYDKGTSVNKVIVSGSDGKLGVVSLINLATLLQ